MGESRKSTELICYPEFDSLLHLPGRNEPGGTRYLPAPTAAPGSPPRAPLEFNSQREADRITISRYGPPGVLVNAELQVLQFRGPTGAFSRGSACRRPRPASPGVEEVLERLVRHLADDVAHFFGHPRCR